MLMPAGYSVLCHDDEPWESFGWPADCGAGAASGGSGSEEGAAGTLEAAEAED